jgi:hypothetical protein
MSRTLSQYLDFTQNELVSGLMPLYLTINEYLAWVPHIVTDRNSVDVNRALDYGSVQSGVDCGTADVVADISSAKYNFPMINYRRPFETCLLGEDMANSFTDQFQLDLEGAVAAMADQVGIHAINGNGSTQVAGLETLVTTSVNASGVGGAGSLEAIEALFQTVRGAKKGSMALIANDTTIRKLGALITTSSFVSRTELGNTGIEVPTYHGAPLLRGNSIATGRIYLVKADETGRGDGISMRMSTRLGSPMLGGLFALTGPFIHATKDVKVCRLTGSFAHVLGGTQTGARLLNWNS